MIKSWLIELKMGVSETEVNCKSSMLTDDELFFK